MAGPTRSRLHSHPGSLASSQEPHRTPSTRSAAGSTRSVMTVSHTSMNAEIIAIGSELLLGTTVDTNSTYLARQLAAAGVNLMRKSVAADHADHITTLINEALHRADLVICTGGLGPTLDDVTREAVAQAFARPLEFRPELLEQIAARFAAIQRPMGESNQRQAYLPVGARAIPNPRGTAPAFLIEDERGTVIVLPGVPHEMRFLFEHVVVPYLRDERGVRDVILVHTLHVTGMGESVIGERIADIMERSNPTIGTSAKQGVCELRIAARSESREAAEAMVTAVVSELYERLGSALTGAESLYEQIVRLLTEQNLSLALYEGTLVAPIYRALTTNVAASAVLRGVVIELHQQAHDDAAATRLAEHGAHTARERWKSTLALGVQVCSQPDASGLSPVSIALVTTAGTHSETHRYDLRLEEGWQYVSAVALTMLRSHLLQVSGA